MSKINPAMPLKPTEKKLIKLYKQSLKEIRAQLSVNFEKFSKGGKLTMAEMSKYKRLSNLEANIQLELAKLNKYQKRTITKRIKDVFQRGYYVSACELEVGSGLKLGFGMLNPDTVEAAVNNQYDRIGWADRSKTHINTLNNNVREAITRGLIQGEGYGKIAKTIKGRCDIAASKAIRIAQTESHRAQVQGQLKSYDDAANLIGESLTVNRVWDAAIDEKTRSQHASMDGEKADKNGVFTLPDGTKTQGPGLSGVAEHDINCRCSVRAEIEGFEAGKRRVRGAGVVDYQTYNEWADSKGISYAI